MRTTGAPRGREGGDGEGRLSTASVLGCCGTAALAALTLVLAVPARATLPPPNAAEIAQTDQLGRRLAHDIYTMVDLKALILKQFSQSLPDDQLFRARPQWRDLLAACVAEEVERNRPVFDEVFGRVFASRFSSDELRAGVRLLEGPAGADLARSAQARAEGRPVEPLTASGQAAVAAAARTPEGRAFITRFAQVGGAIRPATTEFVARILPAVMIRFGQRAQAAEAAASHAPAAVN